MGYGRSALILPSGLTAVTSRVSPIGHSFFNDSLISAIRYPNLVSYTQNPKRLVLVLRVAEGHCCVNAVTKRPPCRQE